MADHNFFNNVRAFSNLSGGGKTQCAALCPARLDVLTGMPVQMLAKKFEGLICLSLLNIRQNVAKNWILHENQVC